MGDEILPSFIGIRTKHYEDPYEPISPTECHKGFGRCSVEPVPRCQQDIQAVAGFSRPFSKWYFLLWEKWGALEWSDIIKYQLGSQIKTHTVYGLDLPHTQ